MTSAQGLRRFVRQVGPDGLAAPAGQAAPVAVGSAPTAAQVAPAVAPTSAQSAATALPPLMAELLQAAPALLGGAAAPRAEPADDTEKCELCAADVRGGHGHVADLESSTLVCACRACYLLFTQANAGRRRYLAVPDRYLHDPGRPLSAARWDQLEIPVGLAFFLNSSIAGRVTGFYPSPAGATECVLDLAAWQRLAQEYPLLGAAEPDVEAALVCRGESGADYFVVPIDACYELAGRMRLHWRGFDGGAEAKEGIAEFLGRVRSRAVAFTSQA